MAKSRQTEFFPVYKGSRVRGTIRWIFQTITPFEELVEIRAKFVKLFRTLYQSFPLVKESLSEWDNSTLVQEAGEARDKARNYNPHAEIENFVSLLKDIQRLVLMVLAFLTVVAFLLGVSLYPIFQKWFSTASAPLSFLPTIVIALAWLYLGLLRWNRDALQVFNDQLTISKDQIHQKSRKRPDLVSYYTWNSVLQGQTIPTIVCCFYLLNKMAEAPILRRYLSDPAGFLTNEIAEHYDVFTEKDSYLSIVREIFRRKRE